MKRQPPERRFSAAVGRIGRWAGDRAWLRSMYRRLLPDSLRESVSSALREHGQRRLRFERTLLWDAEAPDNLQPYVMADTAPSEGVGLLGYFRGQFGLGECARAYARALLDAGYPASLREADVDVPHSMGDSRLLAHLGQGPEHDIQIVFVNPDHFARVVERSTSAKQYIIGFWFWELAQVPSSWQSALDAVDEVMVASEFVAEAFRAVTDKPVTRITYPLYPAECSSLGRADFGIPESSFAFLCTFDVNSAIERKNPSAVIRAFRAAFADDDRDVFLMLKSANGHRRPDQLQRLLNEIGDDGRIVLRDDVIDVRHLRALQHCCDAYVSLHRAEGLGLGMAECMKAGKPVIATGWSGNRQFMTEDNSLLVDSVPILVRRGEYPDAEGMSWAEPDEGHAAELMRRLVDDRTWAARIGSRAARDIDETLSPAQAARDLVERLKAIREQR